MNKIIGVVDYEAGNLFSVIQACIKLGASVNVVNKASSIEECDALIIPGVGSFQVASNFLRINGIFDSILKFYESGKPILGVCLGMQILFDFSEEFGYSEGLGLLKGRVKKIDETLVDKVPHMGWSQITTINLAPKSPLQNAHLKDVYFVHSFEVFPDDRSIVKATVEYGQCSIVAAVEYNNIFACQFHPEKSSQVGIEIIGEWLKLNKLT